MKGFFQSTENILSSYAKHSKILNMNGTEMLNSPLTLTNTSTESFKLNNKEFPSVKPAMSLSKTSGNIFVPMKYLTEIKHGKYCISRKYESLQK